MSPKYVIPNLLTSLNLFAGAIAIVTAFNGYNTLPVYFLLCAALFDFLDGFAAKLLKATSEFGKQLDSLADLISFGMAPSVLVYLLLDANLPLEMPLKLRYILHFSSFIFVVFAALRLARFNIRTVVHSDFEGLPVPAATLFIVSLWIFSLENAGYHFTNKLLNPFVLIVFNLIVSGLMISRIKMISLKFNGYRFKINMWRYILIGGSAVLFILLRLEALFWIMTFYLLLSGVHLLFSSKKD